MALTTERLQGISPKKLAVLSIIGWLIGIAILLTTRPWTEELGIAYSPSRVAVFMAFTFAVFLPWTIYWCILFARRPERLVPPGKYVPGMKVKIFSTWTYTSIGITAALFIAAAVAGAPLKIDLAGLSIAVFSAYFGSIIASLGIFFGEIIAYGPLAASTGWAVYPGIEVVGYSLLDAAVWAYAAYIIFWMREKYIYKKSRILGIIASMALFEPIHYGFWYFYWFIMNPWSSFVPIAITNLITWVIPAIPLIFIGVLVGDRMYNMALKRIGK